MNGIYLDHAAGSPLRSAARAAMEPLLDSANPSSLHAPGRLARAALDRSRSQVAAVLGVRPREVFFTSGGTEANVAAVLGLARAARGPRRVLMSTVEHRAVLAAGAMLEEEGFEVVRLAVDPGGTLHPRTLAAALEQPAALVSVMLANNEIGTVQPVAELAAVAAERGALFHSDAVQAPGTLPLDAVARGAVSLSLAAHKFGGPQGCGIVYIKAGTPFQARPAGSAEAGRRPGTENVAAIAGAAAALAEADASRLTESPRLRRLRDRLEAEILRSIPDAVIQAQSAARLPGLSSVAFRGADNEALLVALDLRGVWVSSGSACAAGSAERSHVLEAIGVPPWVQRGVIRFSLGHTTTEEDVTDLLRMLPSVVESVRAGAPVEVSH